MTAPPRSSRRFADAFTARAGGLVLAVIAAAELGMGANALASGCIRSMRGRHGPSVLHCAPDPWYWGHTLVALALGAVLAVVAWALWRSARRARGTDGRHRAGS